LANVVVIGAQWGDEGKGKITDLLSRSADVVVRYQGGVNAGHTIVVDDRVLKLHLIPSGILYPDTTCLIGSGTVVDPKVMLGEIDTLLDYGIDVAGLQAHLELGRDSGNRPRLDESHLEHFARRAHSHLGLPPAAVRRGVAPLVGGAHGGVLDARAVDVDGACRAEALPVDVVKAG
jgi:hypothetical protein